MRWTIALSVRTAATVIAACCGQIAQAETMDNPALDLQFGIGYFTYKSKYILSNDTGLRYDYQGSVFSGNARNFGLIVRGNMQTTNFELVKEKLDSSVTDLVLRGYLGPVYFGPVVGIRNLAYTQGSGTPTFDLTERHYGGNFGVEVEVMKRSMLRLDVLGTMQYDYKEVSDKTIKLGMRIDTDFSLEVPFSKSFSSVIGAKYMMDSIDSKAETISMPYGALKGDFNF
jgi:hypothetical protein